MVALLLVGSPVVRELVGSPVIRELLHEKILCYLLLSTAVVSVVLTDSYYEKVSEELEKIVSEEKETDTASTDGKKPIIKQCSHVY